MMHRSVSASCSRALLLQLRAPTLPHMLPMRAAVAAPAPAAAAAATRALHSARATLAPPPKKEKGARGKPAAAAAAEADASEDASDAPQTLDSAAAAGAAASASKAPRESQRDRASSRQALSLTRAQEAKEAADSERRAKRARQAVERQAALESRREKQGIDDVIEKEVPLMDLTGLTPGQNRFTNVLNMLREQNYPEHVIADLESVGDYATGSTAEILSGKLENLRAKYGRKPYDTGSPEVQVAMLTERLKGYDRHMVTHSADIASRRGFLAVWHRRRKMLKYLRRTRYETYAYMMRELQLKESDIDNVGLDRTSGTQAPRIKRD